MDEINFNIDKKIHSILIIKMYVSFFSTLTKVDYEGGN